MTVLQPLVSEFTIIGRLEDFVVNSKGRVKYLYVSNSEEDYSIKVAKEQKNVLGKYLKPGCHLKVTGMRKYKLHQEQAHYKAYKIELLSEQIYQEVISDTAIAAATTKPKAKVLICQSSTCWQQGGKAFCESLQAELHSQGMAEQVKIQTTGCLKKCKQAPNLIMPGRNFYSRVQQQQIPALIAQHLL